MKIRAARLIEHGKPLEVQEVELPAQPPDGEVLVELSYAGVNPVDRYNAAGLVAADGPLPRTLGGEASGYLDGVPVVVAGEGLGSKRDGLFAEAAIVAREAVIEIPEGVSLRDAAAVGVAGSTAWRVVEIAGIGPDDRVLVLGAAGGVGQTIVAYAVSKGAEVWGQTTSESKTDAILAMGAKQAVVSNASGLADAIRDFDPTAVLDPLGGEFTASALGLLAPHGRLVLFGTSAGTAAQIQLQQLFRSQRRVLTYGGLIATRAERREAIAAALAAMAEGKLRLSIGAEVGLDGVDEAFGLLADREVTGKVVVSVR